MGLVLGMAPHARKQPAWDLILATLRYHVEAIEAKVRNAFRVTQQHLELLRHRDGSRRQVPAACVEISHIHLRGVLRLLGVLARAYSRGMNRGIAANTGKPDHIGSQQTVSGTKDILQTGEGRGVQRLSQGMRGELKHHQIGVWAAISTAQEVRVISGKSL